MHIGEEKGGLHLSRPIGVATGVCGLCLSFAAVASPPFSSGGPSRSAIVSARSISLPSRPIAGREYTPTANLDLRAPRAFPAAISNEGATAPAAESFPSSTHHLDPGNSDLGANNRTHTRALGLGGDLDFRVMSQAQIIARRVHQEGLPIARLFQSKSASLSVGLNSRGKPGLWFTQTIH